MSYGRADEAVNDALYIACSGHSSRFESTAQATEQWTISANSHSGPLRPWEDECQAEQLPSLSIDERLSLTTGTNTIPFRHPGLYTRNPEFLALSYFVDDQTRSGDESLFQTGLTHDCLSCATYRSETQYSPTLTTEPGDHLGSSPDQPERSISEGTDIIFCNYPSCDRSFTGAHRRGNFLRHQRISHSSHSGYQDYPCQLCSKVFRRQDARLKHQRKYHPELGTESPVPRAPRKASERRQSRFSYMYPPHTTQDFDFESSQDHTTLQSTDFDSNEEALKSTTSLLDSAGSEQPSHTCSQCDLDFATAGQLNSHVNRKHDQRYKCDSCHRAFNLRADLLRHESSVHTLASAWRCMNEPCLKPGKVFARKDNFRRHVKTCNEALQAQSSASKE